MMKNPVFLHEIGKMKIIRLLFGLCLIVILSALLLFCKKKEDKLIISGTAINEQTGQAVGAMSVTLYAKTITNGTWNTQYSQIQTQTTASDGSFSINFNNMRASEYKLTFSKNGYFKDEYVIQPDLVFAGGDYNNTYLVHFEAWIKLVFKNNPPYSTSDVVSYRFLKGSATCSNGCNDSLVYLYGANVDTYHICKLYGQQNAVVEWNYSNNYSHQQHIDTVWIQSGDTAIHNISF